MLFQTTVLKLIVHVFSLVRNFAWAVQESEQGQSRAADLVSCETRSLEGG